MKGLLKRGLVAAVFGLFAALGLAPSGAQAHGGVKLEQDECVLRLGPSTMHFIAYQRTGEEEEFCQDVARTGPTVIALTAVSPELRDMAIGARIIKDTGAPVAKDNLDALTVAFHEPKVYRNGIMTFEHDFKDAGRTRTSLSLCRPPSAAERLRASGWPTWPSGTASITMDRWWSTRG